MTQRKFPAKMPLPEPAGEYAEICSGLLDSGSVIGLWSGIDALKAMGFLPANGFQAISACWNPGRTLSYASNLTHAAELRHDCFFDANSLYRNVYLTLTAIGRALQTQRWQACFHTERKSKQTKRTMAEPRLKSCGGGLTFAGAITWRRL